MRFKFFQIISHIVIMCIACQSGKTDSCSTASKEYSDLLLDKNIRIDTAYLISKLSHSLKKDSTCMNVLLLRADLYFYEMKFDLSRKDYFKASAINTSIVYPYYKLGLSYELDDNYRTAIHFYEIATEKKTKDGYISEYNTITPNLATEEEKYDVPLSQLVFRQSICYYYLRNLSKAHSGFTYCIQNGYQVGESYYYRGAINIELNKKDSACLDFTDANSLGFKDAEPLLIKYCQVSK